MLEGQATRILNQSEGILMLIGALLVVLGFVFALIIRWGASSPMRRVPYFVSVAAIFTVTSMLPFAWLLTSHALNYRVLWVLLTFVFSALVGVGFVCGALAQARSVSAFGNGNQAWMGATPIVNLILFFKAPLEEPADVGSGMVGNIIGILSGFFMLGVGATMEEVAGKRVQEMADQAILNSDNPSELFDRKIDNQGLEATLHEIAGEVPPQRIDHATYLDRVDGSSTDQRQF